MGGKREGKVFDWVMFLFFTLCFIFAVVGVTSELPKLWEENEKKTVQKLYTTKGMFYGPHFFVKASDGKSHRIFKREFLTLEDGDAFTVLFNRISLQDFLLVSLVAMIFIPAFFMGAYAFASELFAERVWYREFQLWFKRVRKKITFPFRKRALICLLIGICLLVPLSVAKNVFYKIIPVGKTATVGMITDQEIIRSRAGRWSRTIYQMTYQYEDQAGNAYETDKIVSRQTYQMYEDESVIPIAYRNKDPYNTFIANQTLGEYVAPLVHPGTWLVILCASLAVVFLKVYHKRWGIPLLDQ